MNERMKKLELRLDDEVAENTLLRLHMTKLENDNAKLGGDMTKLENDNAKLGGGYDETWK